jgi:hypothetical protein
MKIGVISDSHDHIENLNKALELLKEKDVKILIHCGDFCAPFMMNDLAKFNGEVHCVFGNTADRYLTPQLAEKAQVNLDGDLAELEFDGKKIAVNHYPKVAEGLAYTGKYDAVFYGHNHKADKKKIGETLLLNPGEIMGVKGKPSLAIYNTETNDAEIIEIE